MGLGISEFVFDRNRDLGVVSLGHGFELLIQSEDGLKTLTRVQLQLAVARTEEVLMFLDNGHPMSLPRGVTEEGAAVLPADRIEAYRRGVAACQKLLSSGT